MITLAQFNSSLQKTVMVRKPLHFAVWTFNSALTSTGVLLYAEGEFDMVALGKPKYSIDSSH